MAQLDHLETLDPNDRKDYYIPWHPQLDPFNDTIASSTWIVPTGITKIEDSFSDKLTTIWLTGGTIGDDYELTNHIITNNDPPRELDQTITIHVRKR
jgi:hypothetical protein